PRPVLLDLRVREAQLRVRVLAQLAGDFEQALSERVSRVSSRELAFQTYGPRPDSEVTRVLGLAVVRSVEEFMRERGEHGHGLAQRRRDKQMRDAATHCRREAEAERL